MFSVAPVASSQMVQSRIAAEVSVRPEVRETPEKPSPGPAVSRAEGPSAVPPGYPSSATRPDRNENEPRDRRSAAADRAEAKRAPAQDPAEAARAEAAAAAAEDSTALTDEERDLVERLAARDREVRNHENAHARVGGAYAGAPSYTYQVGPDGQRYAIGGEVKIDISVVPNDPEATINKMVIVKAAALAPAEPSAADRQVAAIAEANRMQAQAELSSQRAAERMGDASDDEYLFPPSFVEETYERIMDPDQVSNISLLI